MGESWTCSKGFHAWGIVYPPSIEAKVLAGVEHPLPTNYSCINCGTVGPVIRRKAPRGRRAVPSLAPRYSGRCINCGFRVEASTEADSQ